MSMCNVFAICHLIRLKEQDLLRLRERETTTVRAEKISLKDKSTAKVWELLLDACVYAYAHTYVYDVQRRFAHKFVSESTHSDASDSKLYANSLITHIVHLKIYRNRWQDYLPQFRAKYRDTAKLNGIFQIKIQTIIPDECFRTWNACV